MTSLQDNNSRLIVENYTEDLALLPKIPTTHMENIKNIDQALDVYLDTFRACIYESRDIGDFV